MRLFNWPKLVPGTLLTEKQLMEDIEFKQKQYLKECAESGVLYVQLKMKNPPPPPDKKKSIWDAWQISNDEAMIMADYYFEKYIQRT